MVHNSLHLITICRESPVSAIGSIIVFSSKLRLLLVFFFIIALDVKCIAPSFPETRADRNAIVSIAQRERESTEICRYTHPKSEFKVEHIPKNIFWYELNMEVYMPDNEIFRWRPGLSSFHTFTVAGSSLSLDEAAFVLVGDVLLSRV